LSDMHRQLQKLEHCGHSPQRDQPAITIARIAGFLQNLT
jgi:pimeloyl-ACP methyl ester carboxylesterase